MYRTKNREARIDVQRKKTIMVINRDKGFTLIELAMVLGQQNGAFRSCDAGLSTQHSSAGGTIYAMSEFSGLLCLSSGSTNGSLLACDSSGTCSNYGVKGSRIDAMAVFDSSL